MVLSEKKITHQKKMIAKIWSIAQNTLMEIKLNVQKSN